MNDGDIEAPRSSPIITKKIMLDFYNCTMEARLVIGTLSSLEERKYLSVYIEKMDLGLVFEISINCFEKMKGHKYFRDFMEFLFKNMKHTFKDFPLNMDTKVVVFELLDDKFIMKFGKDRPTIISTKEIYEIFYNHLKDIYRDNDYISNRAIFNLLANEEDGIIHLKMGIPLPEYGKNNILNYKLFNATKKKKKSRRIKVA